MSWTHIYWSSCKPSTCSAPKPQTATKYYAVNSLHHSIICLSILHILPLPLLSPKSQPKLPPKDSKCCIQNTSQAATALCNVTSMIFPNRGIARAAPSTCRRLVSSASKPPRSPPHPARPANSTAKSSTPCVLLPHALSLWPLPLQWPDTC